MNKKFPAVIIFLALYLTCGVISGLTAQEKQKQQPQKQEKPEKQKPQKEQQQPTPQVGGYQETPKDDPATVAAAKFAVSERQTKEGGTMSLVSVKRAETQLVAGVNYWLCLKVKVNGKSQKVTAVVNKTLTDTYSLTSWESGGCKKH
jgi:uncharacterized alpha/beta hydrolase family protein